jgi:hypothetical protein
MAPKLSAYNRQATGNPTDSSQPIAFTGFLPRALPVSAMVEADAPGAITVAAR